jgi:peptide/nickel transport system permease protein
MRTAVRRVSNAIPLFLFSTLLCFAMLHLMPGDPVVNILGDGAGDPEKVAALTQQLGLDRPFLVQYGTWLTNMLRGDLGDVYNVGMGGSVGSVITDRFPVTLELAVISLMLALVISVPLAVIAASRPGSMVDSIINAGTYAALATPGFVLGPLLIFVFGIQLRWLPVGGLVAWSESPTEHLRSLVLPAITLAMTQVPSFTRLLRADLESTLKEDFILFARSRGLSDRAILLRHALRPSSLTLLTVAGVNLGGLLGGTVIAETLFDIKGLGTALTTAIGLREHLLVLGIVTVITVAVLALTTAVDVVYPLVDPRVRANR